MRIKLENHTKISDESLKAFFEECIRREGMEKTPFHITVKNTYDTKGIHGSAYLGLVCGNPYSNTWHGSIDIYIPNYHMKYEMKGDEFVRNKKGGMILHKIDTLDLEKLNKEVMAKTFIHEIGHVRKLRHKEMIPYKEIDVTWAKDYPMVLKAKKHKVNGDLRKERYRQVLKHIKDKKSKIKRFTNALKKWEKKRKYYEKTIEELQ